MFLLLFSLCAFAQQIGHQKPEQHPSLEYKECTKSGGCQSMQKSVVIDANWRWVHNVGGYTNCYTGNKWDKNLCPDGKTCAQNCAVDGADYPGTYGVSTSGDALKLGFVTHGSYGDNVGSRLYLLDDENTYKTFKLLNKEFTIDVDVSKLPCGLNGALYFVEMDADGGMSKYSSNKAGAQYGTGYCDAQCPHDIKFINGEANCEAWNGTSANSGSGKYGTCCVEMDIWESNMNAQAVTGHPCTTSSTGQTRCEGKDCGDNGKNQRYDGLCDKDGCDINPYRLGSRNFFGNNSAYMLDSTKKMTVVTQFITDNGQDNGNLKEIKRLYVQNGRVIHSPSFNMGGDTYDSINDDFCQEQKKEFGDTDSFTSKGGMKKLGEAFARGSMVLVMSIWDDHDVHMVWLDSNDPVDADPNKPGVARGPCATSSGDPDEVERMYPDSSVTYSNIRFGELDSTYSGGNTPTTPKPSPGGCPGGSLSACIGLCPSDPPAAYSACVKECVSRCS